MDIVDIYKSLTLRKEVRFETKSQSDRFFRVGKSGEVVVELPVLDLRDKTEVTYESKLSLKRKSLITNSRIDFAEPSQMQIDPNISEQKGEAEVSKISLGSDNDSSILERNIGNVISIQEGQKQANCKSKLQIFSQTYS